MSKTTYLSHCLVKICEKYAADSIFWSGIIVVAIKCFVFVRNLWLQILNVESVVLRII